MTEHHDRETVVVERDRGSALGTILGIVVIVALLVGVWWFTLGPGAGRTTTNQGGGGTNVQQTIEAPTPKPASS